MVDSPWQRVLLWTMVYRPWTNSHKQNCPVEAYSCILAFYNYEKEDYKHNYTRGDVYCVVYRLCCKARSSATAATGSSGATAASAI